MGEWRTQIQEDGLKFPFIIEVKVQLENTFVTRVPKRRNASTQRWRIEDKMLLLSVLITI